MANDSKKTSVDEATTIFRMPPTDATTPDLLGRESLAHPTLSVIKGPQTGVTFTLETPQITIGRDPRNDVFLNDMTVSRHHARIDFVDGTAEVSDLGSLNGTWVDGAIINRAPLADGSTLQVGSFRMVFHTTRGTEKITVG
ncbi:MAG: FHA domain-containing protein [Atopobiaceae bacterium]|jgi:pSer/pThr/pTyr-binding forkhead associated (FHA) protein|nr:FHA domain-containing protein [Atopobiaceae bacterium]MCH4179991.1 FHA domain-containing protein [Atopobiaceae bacterium]MCH4213957.1 FHA domain-containing protein [Atopobiaceae bacterium]MCH4230183.1 FHA domain-containing protein [Atopobiaceae bacterium]MCH4275580.1 FHA domain-containing protein [Atopobiaceae bacterium]